MAIRISSLGRYNPWWKKSEGWESEDIRLRNIEEIIPRKDISLREGDIFIIRGIRRSGKSVYLRLLIKSLIERGVDPRKILYISCDRYTLREIRNIVDEFRRREEKIYIFLDEITYLKDWKIFLKILGEEDITTIATGSNPISIKREVETLPGRGVEGNEYYFNPLNFKEFLNYMRKDIPNVSFRYDSPQITPLIPYYDEIESLFYRYILTGGFPEAVIALKNGRDLSNIYEEIIRLVLGEISKAGKDEHIAREILEYLLRIKGGRFDYVSVARELEISHPTVKEYLNVLENARIIYTLEAWDLDKKRHAHKKQKKVIFQSTLIPISLGIYLFGYSPDDFVDENIEFLAECTASSHIIWSLESPLIREKHSFAGFYYDQSKECDLLIHTEKFFGIETKYGKVKKRKYPFELIYLSKEEIEEDNVIPLSLYLAGIEKSPKNI